MAPRRLTPLLVVPELGPHLDLYDRLGFEAIESGTPGIVSLRAGNSFLFLATTAAMLEMFQSDTVAALQGQMVPYMHVASLQEAMCELLPDVGIVDVAGPPRDCPHAVVRAAGMLMIVAERAPGPRWRDDEIAAQRSALH